MLFDKERNKISLCGQQNNHLLILGKSGSGKTFCCCRRLEEAARSGEKALVVDFSGSYREEELRKSQFSCWESLQIFNPAQNPYYFLMRAGSVERFQKEIVNTFVKILKIQSYIQKALISQAVGICIGRKKEISPLLLYETLEKMLLSSIEKDEIEFKSDLEKVLARLEICADIGNVHIRMDAGGADKCKNYVTILQLSDFPERQRVFLTELYITLMWQEIIMNPGKNRYDLVLLDEFQHLPLSGGGVLSSILREGRRFGISAILSSQFISNYSKEERDTLLQAGNLLVFKPVAKSMRFFADIIDCENIDWWKKALGRLQTGEAVLVGQYLVNESTLIQDKPVICVIR